MSEQPPARFESFKRQAESLVQSPGRVRGLLGQAVKKLSQAGGGKFTQLRQQLTLAMALLRAWLDGDYRQVSQRTVVVVAAALLYFVVPLDVIPDFLFGWGLLDDAAVLAYVFAQVSDELSAFENWQKEQLQHENDGTNDEAEDKAEDETDNR